MKTCCSVVHDLRIPSAYELGRAVDGVCRLRNRAALLDSLLNSNIAAQLANMRTVIGAINHYMLSWFASVEKVGAVLNKRPSYEEIVNRLGSANREGISGNFFFGPYLGLLTVSTLFLSDWSGLARTGPYCRGG